MITFVLLSFEDSIAFWRSLYFVGHIVLIVGLVTLTLAGGNKSSRPRGEKPPLVHRDTPHPRSHARGGAGGETVTTPYKLRSRNK